ncbi:hypothetical protein ANANG_G00267180 [Anguilla anguilla]|uniref:Protein crumbs homolog 2 n=1 Tax=Anguilla anguilla TaxID=7936 RepID=A0A9D3RLP5_ANGAN|nr:hypothetical protein ANANG_G00267180 [Anguilla anguilla]
MEFGRIHSKFHKTLLITMMMFKWGIFCSGSSDKCLSEPCQNGATCVDTMDDYVCLCPREAVAYMGKDCQLLYDGCSFARCPGCTSVPGTRQHTCPCPPGFAGPNCTLDVDDCQSAPCGPPRDVCVDGVDAHFCVCPAGFGGEDCRTECPPGFRGERCEEDVDECLSDPCRNGAICLDGADQYHCFCVPGFQGYNCEIDINECASRPCENNATCVNEKDRYACACLLGFTGVNCEMEIDECGSDPCQNGATCQDQVGLYTCECVPGFQGPNCEVNIDECVSAPCLNNGTCNDLVNRYSCDCSDTGFTGEHCEEDIPECASDPCQNGATCWEGVKLYSCLCWPGYEGERCEVDIDECEAQPCENGGECIQRSDRAHYGELPEREWEFYAYAAGYLCQCQPGYAGENCSLDIDECLSSPCLNGGSCEDHINGYTCTCPPGFTGLDCEVNIDECESAPCQNGALCQDGVADYTCVCPELEPDALPWGGRHCDVLLLGCVAHACENGATCRPWVASDGLHGSTCVCPPGFYGELCATPTTFSFSTPGFVLVEVPPANRSRRWAEPGPGQASVSLRLRTTLPDMVVFHRGDAHNFLSLEIVGGSLRARAESEGGAQEAWLEGVVSDGDWQEVGVVVGAGLMLVLKGAGCEGEEGCRAENMDPAVTFDPMADSMNQVYVGGVPDDYLDTTKTRTGFVGCMEDLLVDGRPILPQNLPPGQAEDLQLGCHKTEWCQPDPCSDHGQCIDLWTHFRCDCHRPFHGDSCEEEYPSWTFSHENSSSYAAFDIPDALGSDFSASFFLRSLKRDGLLLQLQREGAPYLSVFLRMGRLWAAARTHPRRRPVYVADGERRLVELELRQGLVSLRQGAALYPLGALPAVGVEAGDSAFVGGLPEGGGDLEAWGALQGLPSRRADAKDLEPGCISDDTCLVEPCQNGGECRVTWNDFACACPVFFTGKTCETRVWCVSDPCVMGGRCVDLPDGYECLSNATFESSALRFSAGGSLVAPVTGVSMELRTRTSDGVLLRASLGEELFSVGLRNSSLLVRIRHANGLEALAFSSRRPVADGDWHRVRVSMAEPQQGASRWLIAVDGWSEGGSPGSAGSLDFLGEAPVWVGEEFAGCLGDVRVGGVYLPFVDDGRPPQPARFVRDGGGDVRLGCAGRPVCLSQPCQNDGACLDLFDLLACSCAPGWEGPLCERDTDDCAAEPCAHGVCADLLGGFRCDCAPGYEGDLCQEDVDDCPGHGCQNGGTCVDGVDLYTCVCPRLHRTPLPVAVPTPAV